MKAYLSPIVIFLAVALVIVVVVIQSNDIAPTTPAVVQDAGVGDETDMTADMDAVPPQPVPADTVAADTAVADAAETDAMPAVTAESNTVLGALQASGQHETLLKAVMAAGVADAWNAEAAGDVTLFAPVDSAFAMLPAGTLDSLLAPENKAQLENVLLRHIVNERLTLSDVEARATDGRLTLKSAAGSDIVLVRMPSGPWGVETEYAQTGTILNPDQAKLNGIVQVIDRVLTDAATMNAAPTAEEGAPVADEAAPATP